MGTIALVGLGGNLGDAAETVRRAFQELDALPNTRLLRASRLYAMLAMSTLVRMSHGRYVSRSAHVVRVMKSRSGQAAYASLMNHADSRPS